jgi:hypothetical protein
MTDQLALEIPEPPHREPNYVFGGSDQPETADTVSGVSPYRDQVAARAKSVGLSRAKQGDPEGFDLACSVIRSLAGMGSDFTADDVRRESPIKSNSVGAAFGHLRRAREIACVGYTTSEVPSRHGAVIRVWRGRDP